MVFRLFYFLVTMSPENKKALTPFSSKLYFLLKIAGHISYKSHPDLNIYKGNRLESTFVEIIIAPKSNIVIDWLYKHPNMDVLDLNNYLNQIFEILFKERK